MDTEGFVRAWIDGYDYNDLADILEELQGSVISLTSEIF